MSNGQMVMMILLGVVGFSMLMAFVWKQFKKNQQLDKEFNEIVEDFREKPTSNQEEGEQYRREAMESRELEDYNDLVDKLVMVMGEHESRQKSVLGRELATCLDIDLSSKEVVMKMIAKAQEVISRQKTPMGKVLMSEAQLIIRKYA